MMGKIKEFHIFALASHGSGISGGDRIWIELSRRWSKKFPISIHTWIEGVEMAKRQKLDGNKDLPRSGKLGLRFRIYDLGVFCKFGFAICYISRIFRGILIGFTLQLENKNSIYIYNASEFWMDAFPCAILKMRYPKLKWIATWYQTAPNPFVGFSEKERSGAKYRLRALAYWLTQLPVKPFITKYADSVIVNNEDERKHFPNKETIVLIGAVPLDDINQYREQRATSRGNKKYDAVFQGRFHPQKGVVELIDIWRKVVQKIPNAKLAMIGDGPLMENVKLQISNAKLTNHVKLFGYVFDGKQKYDIFANSKLVVHPAFYDSGGMATAEAMAFGIPSIGFNLKAYDSYYPKAMVKVKNENEFAEEIVSLLQSKSRRNKLGREADILIKSQYSWDKRAGEVLDKIML